MNTNSLAGKRIAVLMESEYIPSEIKTYQSEFPKRGAEVHFMSRLWGQPSATFFSDQEDPRMTPETFTVTMDFQDVNLNDYDAVIMAANYTSVRLRYFERSGDTPISEQDVTKSPAVEFYAAAMRNPKIIKGALCHGLWILTPYPDLLKGRKVVCHEVVLADIKNAGAVYEDQDIVVDRDLVTGRTGQQALALVDAITESIINPPKLSVLTVLSEYGYWGEELVGPKEELERVGGDLVYATPTGKRPYPIGVSMDAQFVDPPLGRPVVSAEVAQKVTAINQSSILNNPLDISALMPERPYLSDDNYLRRLEEYYLKLEKVKAHLNQYDALLLVGGSGPVVDMVNNWRIHDMIRIFYELGKPIAAECYAVTALVFARDVRDRKCLLKGKHVTGHPIEFDYKMGWGVQQQGSPEPSNIAFNFPPYTLEYILEDAVGCNGQFIGNVGNTSSVVVDYPFITSRSTASSYGCGEKLVEVLTQGLTRFGW
ncbi:thiamine biosynthesis protein ThiJ [Marinilabiliaceae bacterium JC017]|nr:thiamine biosynthesis protein ThiJ [Marinilabiliaceae bacterium JC017]